MATADGLGAFLAKLEADSALRDSLSAAKGLESIISITKQAGLDLDQSVLDILISDNDDRELSSQDLELVAGGMKPGDLCKQFPLATKQLKCTKW